MGRVRVESIEGGEEEIGDEDIGDEEMGEELKERKEEEVELKLTVDPIEVSLEMKVVADEGGVIDERGEDEGEEEGDSIREKDCVIRVCFFAFGGTVDIL